MMDGAHLPMAGDRLDALKSSCSREECSTLLLPLLVFLTSNEIINGRVPTWVAGVQSGASSGGHWQKEIQRWRPKLSSQLDNVLNELRFIGGRQSTLVHSFGWATQWPFAEVEIKRRISGRPFSKKIIDETRRRADVCLRQRVTDPPALCVIFWKFFFFSSKTKVNKVLLKRHQRPFWSGMCDGQVSEVLERAGRFQGRPFPFSRSTFLCSVFLNDIPPWMEGSCWRIVNA